MTMPQSSSSPDGRLAAAVRTVLASLVVVSLLLCLANLRRDTGEVNPREDFYAIYAAGFSWNGGFSPYVPEEFAAKYAIVAGVDAGSSAPVAFTYPPIVLPFSGLLAGLPIPIAISVLISIQLVLAPLVSTQIMLVLAQHRRAGLPELALSSVLLNAAYVRVSFYEASSALLTLALLLGAALLLGRREAAAGILIGAASLNPIAGCLMLGYALLRQAYVAAAIGLLAAAALNVAPLILLGLPVIETLADWLSAAAGVAPTPDLSDSLVALAAAQTQHLGRIMVGGLVAALVGAAAYVVFHGGARKTDPLPDLALAAAAAQLIARDGAASTFLLAPAALYSFLQASHNGGRSRALWGALAFSLIIGLIVPWDQIGAAAGWPGAEAAAYATMAAVVVMVLLARAFTGVRAARQIQLSPAVSAPKRSIAG